MSHAADAIAAVAAFETLLIAAWELGCQAAVCSLSIQAELMCMLDCRLATITVQLILQACKALHSSDSDGSWQVDGR